MYILSRLTCRKGGGGQTICIFMKEEPGDPRCSPAGGRLGGGGLERGWEPLHKDVCAVLPFNYVTELPIQKKKSIRNKNSTSVFTSSRTEEL